MPTRRCSVPSAASLAGPILAAMSALAAVPALADAAAGWPLRPANFPDVS